MALVAKPDDLNLISKTYTTEKENQLSRVVLYPPHTPPVRHSTTYLFNIKKTKQTGNLPFPGHSQPLKFFGWKPSLSTARRIPCH